MKSLKICCFLFFIIISSVFSNCFGQLTVTPGASAAVLASTLAGPGVTILNPTLTCPAVANGTFTVTGTLLGMSSGILLTNGHAAAAAGPYGPPPGTASFNLGAPGDPSLNAILGGGSTTYDACVLQFDVVAKGDSIGFNYQFGSQEYYSAVCSHYNDLFAFFISGPGIVGAPNMALVPGTTIPVEINSVNNGIPGSSGGVLSNCTSLGPGSPFTSYYIDNTGGTLLSYKGFTTKFRAAHLVTACDTYHLKLAIADAGNAIYDSGVFLEAASLSTNNFTFNHADSIGATINGIPNTIVRGCSPASITVLCSHPLTTAETLILTYGGTAIHGTDYTAPNTLTLPSGADSGSFTVSALPSLPSGTKSVKIYLSSSTTCGILDSVMLNIIDTPSASILTPDTTICSGVTFQLRAAGTAGLSYIWSPAGGLSSSTLMQPMATPAATTTYTMSATLPGSGCPAITKSVAVNVVNTSISIVTPNTSICYGGSVNLIVSGNPALTYSWSPAAGLSNPNIQNPVATPVVTTSYTVTATGPGGLCPSTASVTITISTLSVSLLTPDTSVCLGQSFTVRATGPTGPTYTWSPAAGLSSPSVITPVITPLSSTEYFLNVTWPGSGCPDITDSFKVTVFDATITLMNSDTSICSGNTVDLMVAGGASLTYSWSPAAGLNNAYIPDPIASPTISTTYSVTATAPGSSCSNSASVTILVGDPLVYLPFTDTTICLGTTVYMPVTSNPDYVYSWTPATGLSNPSGSDPLASPTVSTVYTITVSAPGFPCVDTGIIRINVESAFLTNVTSSQTIPYGSSIQLNADNVLYYMWSPDDGSLSNASINNPIATPKVPSTYVVTGMSKSGCIASDTVKIDLTYDDIYIPLAFTPNNDGHNDFFHVVNLGFYKLVEMNVYDRWGVMVYHVTDGDNRGWDGTFQGLPQDLGVYNYLVIVEGPQGIQKIFKGDVTLIR